LSKASVGKFLKKLHLRSFILKNFSQAVESVPEDQHFGEGCRITDLISQGKIDWEKTMAISTSLGGIELNTKDRPQGTVSLGKQQEKMRQEIKGRLINFGKKNGLEFEVFTPDQLYRGEFVSQAPDLQFRVENRRIEAINNVPYKNKLFQVFKKGRRFANHRKNGICLIHGPGIKKGNKMKLAHIYDIAPTVLSFFGIKSPPDFDGKILKEAFKNDQ
jgi:predicted AlkP superfamily phosphohydrolase/phosphomutase